ncbi:MAG: response regulator [Acidobacteriota bacterium]
MKKKILVAVQDEILLAVINEVLSKLDIEIVIVPAPTTQGVAQLMPSLIIVDHSEDELWAESLFKSTIHNEPTSEIPFMFIVPESSKWNEIGEFRLGFDTKVSKEHPKLGMQLRVQAILKKSRPVENVSGRVKDIQQLMQAILKKRKAEGQIDTNSGTFAPLQISVPRNKILVVEDEPATRLVLQSALESNYDMIFAANGQEGLDMIISQRPDLIISDFMMPIMDGLEMLDRMRSAADVARTPFLFLTAKSQVEDKIEGLEHGADEYLSKPFSVRELQLRVSKLIEVGRNRRGATGALNGQLSEVALPDVLQIMGNNRKTGELIINVAALREPARVYFEEGQVVNASFAHTSGLKAFFRILALDEGSFTFETKSCQVKRVINDKLENLMLEGYRQFDEFEMLRLRFPNGLGALLRPGTEKAVQTGLSTVDALALFAVGREACVKDVLDAVTYTDFEVLQSIINLLDIGLLTTD